MSSGKVAAQWITYSILEMLFFRNSALLLTLAAPVLHVHSYLFKVEWKRIRRQASLHKEELIWLLAGLLACMQRRRGDTFNRTFFIVFE